MKRCDQCGFHVDNPLEHCPLCYATLLRVDGQLEVLSYPDLSKKVVRYNIIWRALLVLSIMAGSICLTINWLTNRDFWWSLLVIVSILYIWITVGTAIRRRTKIGFNILVQVINLLFLVIFIDIFAGNKGWALNYVVPLLFVTAMVCDSVIVVIRRAYVGVSILGFLLVALLGFLPIFLNVMKLTTILWPALASALCSAISLISIFLFAGQVTKNELIKRFRI